MKNNVKHKPLSVSEYNRVKGKNHLVDLILNTGVRRAELKRLIDQYKDGDDYIDIKTKKSNGKNRIYLNKSAINNLNNLKDLKGVSDKTLYRKILSFSDEIGIPFVPHNLRSTFATLLLMNGNDIVTIQNLMNHSDVSVTAKYIQFDEHRLRVAVNTLCDKDKTIDGMNLFEAKNEIVRLRKIINKLESNRG